MQFDIIREDEAWANDDALQTLTNKAASSLGDLVQDNDHVTYVFSNDASVQTLNRDFRNKDKPTNVLSFPDGDVDPDGQRHLGDIVIAIETVTREALDESKTFDNHLIHLLIHGTLHLLGYDHLNDKDAEEMESLEITLLKKIGIGNPYQDA
ncbi:MAG TPA: rRNA maturation RNase YbeY [Alphaproteobacteria bacterium]